MDLKIFTNNIEDKALEQVKLLVDQEAFKEAKVRIMPDVHSGAGCVIGFTADLGEKVIPNIVGVDIGCGVMTIFLGNINIDLEEFDKIVKDTIPVGFSIRTSPIANYVDMIASMRSYRDIVSYAKWTAHKWNLQIGTLGGGNHFIELDKDDQGNVYLLIHTGSRNLGKQVADYYQNKAIEFWKFKDARELEKKEAIENLKNYNRSNEIQEAIKNIDRKYDEMTPIVPKDLSYLMGEDRDDYLNDMKICQEFARINRLMIAKSILNKLLGEDYVLIDEKDLTKSMIVKTTDKTISYFDTIHNYIDNKNMVRKGAVSAFKNEYLIIPINMRDGALFCVGKGNPEWNNSAPHGAGRLMSRGEAKRTLTLEEFKDSMKDIYSTTVNEGTIDEAPMVYKPIDEIVKNIGDTVDIIKIIKPIYNFKATDLE